MSFEFQDIFDIVPLCSLCKGRAQRLILGGGWGLIYCDFCLTVGVFEAKHAVSTPLRYIGDHLNNRLDNLCERHLKPVTPAIFTEIKQNHHFYYHYSRQTKVLFKVGKFTKKGPEDIKGYIVPFVEIRPAKGQSEFVEASKRIAKIISSSPPSIPMDLKL